MVDYSGIVCALLVSAVCVHSQRPNYEIAAAAPIPECETIKGQRCVFPFTYKGKIYNSCTNDGTVNGKAWCAYETSRDGTAIPGKWEDCDTSVCVVPEVCKTESGPDSGNSCKFPFRFNGQTYNSCARWNWSGDNYGKYWCSTKTDRYGNHVNGQGNYGFCGFCDNPVCGCGCGIDARKNFAQSAFVGAGDSISFGAASGNSPA